MIVQFGRSRLSLPMVLFTDVVFAHQDVEGGQEALDRLVGVKPVLQPWAPFPASPSSVHQLLLGLPEQRPPAPDRLL